MRRRSVGLVFDPSGTSRNSPSTSRESGGRLDATPTRTRPPRSMRRRSRNHAGIGRPPVFTEGPGGERIDANSERSTEICTPWSRRSERWRRQSPRHDQRSVAFGVFTRSLTETSVKSSERKEVQRAEPIASPRFGANHPVARTITPAGWKTTQPMAARNRSAVAAAAMSRERQNRMASIISQKTGEKKDGTKSRRRAAADTKVYPSKRGQRPRQKSRPMPTPRRAFSGRHRDSRGSSGRCSPR